MTVATSLWYQQTGNGYEEDSLKMARMAGSGSRLPLQPRSATGSTTSLSSGGTEDYEQSSAATTANRVLSNLESSNNENNKRITSMRGNDSISSTEARTGAPSFGQIARCASTGIIKPAGSSSGSGTGVAKPKLTRSNSEPLEQPNLVRTSSTQSQSVKSDSAETVTIEEKRRKINGEGHTIHRYLRGRLLGKGGFAKVYHCTALDTNKSYAVKIIPKSNLVKPRARQKLQAEIKIHRTLKHHHVCEYKHFFEDRNNCYILLELCHNQSMNELIKRRKRLTEPEAAYYLKQLLEAVLYMHEVCVIHRDLKLGNLFLDKNLHIKVGDLGLSTRLEKGEEKRKTICGTPNYIAPEIIQGSRETRGHSFEVDIWSMGVILYTCLVGKPPYEAKDVKSTYQRIIANQYSFPSHIIMSRHARDLITAMLQSKPHKRPTIDEIHHHPFLTANSFTVPKSLPSNATHVAPEWREDEHGNLVAVKRNEDENASRASRKKASQSSSRRQPLGRKDSNADRPAQSDDGHRLNKHEQIEARKAPAATRNAAAATGNGKRLAFKIYDESKPSSHDESKKRNHAKPPQARVDDLTEMTSALSLKSPGNGAPVEGEFSLSPYAETPKPKTPSTMDQDAKILHSILDNVNAKLAKGSACKNAGSPKTDIAPVDWSFATTWVARYVDYTSKYGLGFLLNDGSSGVYFNDSTKAVLESEGENFLYVERKKVPAEANGGSSVRRSEPLCEEHTLSSYPESLQKKVTLLKHFRNYLIEQQKRAEEEESETLSNTNAVAGDELVYLKKWIRTKHAILFRLSDQTIQIVFYDQTELLLTPDERFISYVDKKRNRSTHHFKGELIASNTEIAKRLKYAKEILYQLVAGQRK